jgi:hypothetical protein
MRLHLDSRIFCPVALYDYNLHSQSTGLQHWARDLGMGTGLLRNAYFDFGRHRKT